MMTPIAANTLIVVGSATIWPIACARWLRPNRVKSGMFSDRVAQKPIIAVSDDPNTGKNPRHLPNFPFCARIGQTPFALSNAHQTNIERARADSRAEGEFWKLAGILAGLCAV